MSGPDQHEAPASREPRHPGRTRLVTGWIHIILGLLIGAATAVGVVAGGLSGTETPFFILLACLMFAVGVFALAVRLVPVIILAMSLLLLGLFLGIALLIGGAVFGGGDGGAALAVGITGILLALLEAWSMLAVWRTRRRSTPGSDASRATEGQDEEERVQGDRESPPAI
jgi:hypothetical protein